ncbi:MAG: K(+)-transporting ATPase subunit C [Bacteroidetes bacterium]|nr:K(+)-transporting ATPase subunit C [Bacteroidota bacterium]
MFKNLKQSLILTVFTIMLFGLIYPLFIFAVAQLMPDRSIGSPVTVNGKTIGFENIGQSFTDEKYFMGRPSAVGYNAASAGGSNKGPSNPDYLAEVQARIDTFIFHNPDVRKEDIPSEMVTASGSGLDPHISPQGACIQISRIAKKRNLNTDQLKELIRNNTEEPLLGLFGMKRVNVLKLNIALDKLK